MTVMTTIDVAIGKLKEQKLDELSEVLLDVGIAHHIHHISDEDFAVSNKLNTSCTCTVRVCLCMLTFTVFFFTFYISLLVKLLYGP